MAYKDKIERLCQDMHVENDPVTGIPEDRLSIAALVFYGEKSEFLATVGATKDNRGGRLFMASLTGGAGQGQRKLVVLDNVRDFGREHWTNDDVNLWDDCSPEKRTLVYWFKHARLVDYIYK